MGTPLRSQVRVLISDFSSGEATLNAIGVQTARYCSQDMGSPSTRPWSSLTTPGCRPSGISLRLRPIPGNGSALAGLGFAAHGMGTPLRSQVRVLISDFSSGEATLNAITVPTARYCSQDMGSPFDSAEGSAQGPMIRRRNPSTRWARSGFLFA